jgi:hypothetical protein
MCLNTTGAIEMARIASIVIRDFFGSTDRFFSSVIGGIIDVGEEAASLGFARTGKAGFGAFEEPRF